MSALQAWYGWLTSVWAQLLRGQRAPVPAGMPHPSAAGFTRPGKAWKVGQIADWVLSLADGSRVHVHEYASGAMIAHRDRTDPARGPLHALWHVATETPLGLAAGVVGLVVALGRTA